MEGRKLRNCLYKKFIEGRKKLFISELQDRLQEFDGGFFEKFGTLLNDQVKQDEEAVVAEQTVVDDTTDEEPENEEEKRADLISDVVALNPLLVLNTSNAAE
ncbi:unnamed protein product [Nezara viridula]|uniref:Uncharacterized protein n=1 Tax=Nezara viridula TaxID=85310 RepID=A0A9P0H1K3_NEZVI|nr:unnamed protein product [Nezara viridula]